MNCPYRPHLYPRAPFPSPHAGRGLGDEERSVGTKACLALGPGRAVVSPYRKRTPQMETQEPPWASAGQRSYPTWMPSAPSRRRKVR